MRPLTPLLKDNAIAFKGGSTFPACLEAVVGYQNRLTNPSAILLRNNGLHVELQFADHPIADADPAGNGV